CEPPPAVPPVPVLVGVRVAGTYPTVRTDPIPDFWCGQVNLFKSNQFDDPPPPVLLAAPEKVAELNALAPGIVKDTWEARLDIHDLRRDQAQKVVGAMDAMIADYTEALGFRLNLPRGPLVRRSELGAANARGGTVA